jgi:hypothetical protein
MKNDDEFAAWIAGVVLRSSGEDIQAEVLEDLVHKTGPADSLDKQIEEAWTASKRAGDFGAEFIGAVLLPVLIEAGKELWSVYLKKLTEKAGEQLAAMTIDAVKMLAHRIWSGEEKSVTAADYEKLLRAAAAKHGLSFHQTEQLVAGLRDPELARALNPV